MPIIINTCRKIKVCGQHYNAKDKRVDFDLTFNFSGIKKALVMPL